MGTNQELTPSRPCGQKPVVSVVILPFNSTPPRPSGEQLDALTRPDFDRMWELVVVDNASTDGTAALAESFRSRLPAMRLLHWATSGSNTSRNAGLRAAKAPLLLLADADDVVAPGWMSVVVAALADHDIVGGHLDIEIRDDDIVRASRDGPTADSLPSVYWHLPYAVPANMTMRRDVFDPIGGFDEDLSVGGDKTDSCCRTQYRGFAIGNAADAAVNSRYKARTRDAMRQAARYGMGNARVCALHIETGHLPSLRSRQKASIVKCYGLELLHFRQLAERAGRRRYFERCAWFVGSLVGLARFGATV